MPKLISRKLISAKINPFKGTVMQTEETLINNRLRVSKVS